MMTMTPLEFDDDNAVHLICELKKQFSSPPSFLNWVVYK